MKPTTHAHAASMNKLLSISVKGWSARARGISLKSVLDGLGKVRNFIHYPETQSTFVRMEVSCVKFLLSRISATMPGIRVERIANSTLREALTDKGSSHLTAFVSRSQYFAETNLMEEIEVFGRIRALEHFYSSKSRNWVCKVTFYEAYSLETLLNCAISKRFLPGLLTGCKVVRMVSIGHAVASEQKMFYKRVISNHIQGCQVSPLPIKTKRKKMVAKKQARCKSAGKQDGPSAEIPFKNIFNHQIDYVSTALGIIQSRARELTGTPSSTVDRRNHSLDYRYMDSDTTKANQVLKKEYKNILSRLNFKEFAFNETSFLEFSERKMRNQMAQPVSRINACKRQKILETPCSYLSESDNSQGFSVCEGPGANTALIQAEIIEKTKELYTSTNKPHGELVSSKLNKNTCELKPAANRFSKDVDSQEQCHFTAPLIRFFTFPTTH